MIDKKTAKCRYRTRFTCAFKFKNNFLCMKNTKSSFPQAGPLFKGLSILGHKCHLLLLQQGTEKCHYFLH